MVFQWPAASGPPDSKLCLRVEKEISTPGVMLAPATPGVMLELAGALPGTTLEMQNRLNF